MACSQVTFLTIFLVVCAFITVNSQKTVISLTEENWKEILQDEWMVEFYAPWCPACKALQKTWSDFAAMGPGLGIKVGQVDVTTSPGLSGRFMVTALPTIYHVLNGQFRQYKGTRDKEAFMTFIEEKKWEQVEPVSSWKAPDSIQMSIVSSFFKLSQMLRQIHNHLMEHYGMPQWGSYLIFALATIILGALLGLILVCVIDFIYPPKSTVVIKKDNKKKEKDSDDELDDEDIRDDLVDDASQSEGEKPAAGSDSEALNADGDGDSSRIKKRNNRRLDM